LVSRPNVNGNCYSVYEMKGFPLFEIVEIGEARILKIAYGIPGPRYV